jgi:hypothetical protein
MSAQGTVGLVRVGCWKKKAREYVRDALSTTAFSKIEDLSIGLIWLASYVYKFADARRYHCD